MKIEEILKMNIGRMPRLFTWRLARIAALGLACLATLVAVFYLVENWRGKHAWRQVMRQLAAKGEKLDLPSYAPPQIPDAENLALCSLLEPIRFRRDGKNQYIEPAGYQRLRNIDLDKLDYRRRWTKEDYKNKSLKMGSLEKGTFTDLAACSEFYRGNSNYPQAAVAGPPAQDVLASLALFDPELSELSAAAERRPRGRFPIAYDNPMPASILLPHLSVMKGLVKVLHLRAIARLELKQSGLALRDVQLIFRLSETIEQEPLLISQLVRNAMVHLNLQVIREGILRHAWTDVQLAELDKLLARTDLLAGYPKTIRGERACAVGSVDYIRQHPREFNLLDLNEGGPQKSGCLPVGWLMPNGWYYQNMAHLVRSYEVGTLRGWDPQARRIFPELLEAQEKELEKDSRSPYRFLSGMLFPALKSTLGKCANGQSLIDSARVACGIERYRLAQGSLPETLAALTPKYLERLPHDLMDGQPLRYARSPDGGYKIYSIGLNKTDDGGLTSRELPSSKDPDVKPGDWVWSMPGKDVKYE